MLGFLCSLVSCQEEKGSTRFQLLDSTDSGIDFSNTLMVNDSVNGITFEYIYNGGGVAVGDVNNDGLKDLFFTGNMVSSALYLNLGNLKFNNVTLESGTATKRWCTGVSMVDINEDGLKDIYICVAGRDTTARQNIFLINQGIDSLGVPHFIDLAPVMGLDDNGYSTMAVFFDYDKDSDLDVFVLTNAMEGVMRSMVRPVRKDGSGGSTDHLFRNDGHGKFANVSVEAGITYEGYGLGVGVADLNADGWPDIYCSDDFISNDLLYINNQDGTFTERSGEYFSHFTHNGMGMDMADFNNDGLTDVLVLDMLPPDNERQKLMLASNKFAFAESMMAGYHPQFLRNTLQLHRGFSPDGKPLYSEIGFLAGVYQTDWSWAPVFADLDNDGWKDLLITNGFRKDVTNLDYIAKIMEISRFGTREANREFVKQSLVDLPDVKLPNYLFKNNGDLTFDDKSSDWGMREPTFSNGAAVADLDNDGDLDLVFNNIDQQVSLYENHVPSDSSHFLKIKFGSEFHDSDIIGTKAWLFNNAKMQFTEFYPFRGYKSTVSDEIHFGLGNQQIIDSLIVILSDGRKMKLHKVQGDTTLVLSTIHFTAKQVTTKLKTEDHGIHFIDVTKETIGLVSHVPASANDFEITPTLLHSLSHDGPYLSVADVNGDGLSDIYMTGDRRTAGRLFIQQSSGTFANTSLLVDSIAHEAASLFFDADNDGDSDFYILSGGYAWPDGHSNYQDRLFLNDGLGKFALSPEALPPKTSSGSCAFAADYDNDGDLDLFVGGRAVGRTYPETPNSYLLRNDGGRFTDCSEFLDGKDGKLGMVTSAVWVDVNADGWSDLIAVGEWMAVTLLINQHGKFINQSIEFGLANTEGWWNHINCADLDNDGDMDMILGNYGLNTFYKASGKKPLELHVGDFDHNGNPDPVVTHFVGDKSYIVHPLTVLTAQIPGMKNRFSTHSAYGKATYDQSFTEEEKSEAITFNCKMLETVVLENVDGKALKIHKLPVDVQFAPVFGSVTSDLNGDGLSDLILVGNDTHGETITGYTDASFGNVLLNQGNFQWKSVQPSESGFIANGDKRAIAKIKLASGKEAFVINENGGLLKVFAAAHQPNTSGF